MGEQEMQQSQMHGVQACMHFQVVWYRFQATIEILPQQPVGHTLFCRQDMRIHLHMLHILTILQIRPDVGGT